MGIIFPGFFLICKQNLREIAFPEFLDILVDRNQPCYQTAWYEFERRYQQLIFRQIHDQMKRWHRGGEVDLMQEIAAMVLNRLIAHDFRALTLFEKREEEGRFKKYLRVISTRQAIAYLSKLHETEDINEKTLTQPQEDFTLTLDSETHKAMVKRIRDRFANTNKSDFFVERDALIYTLRTAGLKSKDLGQIPLFNMKAHNVDVIVDRIKDKFEN
ncbi:MAG: hypothetical protein ACE5HS_13545 [bacterium]